MPSFRALGLSWPLRLAKVTGESMSPTFHDGDILLVRWFDRAQNEIPLLTPVLIERDAMPGIFFIKRIQKSHGGLYWVEGDARDPQIEPRVNDSRSWGYLGAHEIRAKVLLNVTALLKFRR